MLTNEMEKIIKAPERKIVVQAYAGCVDKDTEYFNGEEWKRIEDYERGDLVTQFNTETMESTLTEPLKYYNQPNSTGWYNVIVDGEVIYTCSGNHDILYFEEGKPKKVKASSFTAKDNTFLLVENDVDDRVFVPFVVEKSKFTFEREYCFEVEQGNLLLRKNNKVFVTGNCGKSSTMLEYVKAHPTERILFLVYNKAMSEDFKDRLKGVNHRCDVRTIHSLALRWYRQQGFPNKAFRNVTSIDIQQLMNIRDYEDLTKVMFYWNMFLTSDTKTPKELEVVDKKDKMYLGKVERLWKYFTGQSDSMAHNVYLKMFQLSQLEKPSLNYETIIVDEINDVNECMLSIITSNLDKKVIVVGDSYQMINAFNFNTNGISILKNDYGFKEYNLTNSFRVGESIAKISSKYLNFMYEDNKIKFKGLGHTKRAKLSLVDANPTEQVHLLCRTRLGGLKQIIETLDIIPNKKVYYMGGLKSFGIDEIERVLSYKGTVYIAGQKFHISQLRKMLNEGLEDPEVSRICSIYDFVKKEANVINILKRSEVTNKRKADIILMTAHSSKGLTLENVVIGRDFPPIEDTKDSMKASKRKHKFYQRLQNAESNLMYVALTRSTNKLDIGERLNKREKNTDSIKEVLDYKL